MQPPPNDPLDAVLDAARQHCQRYPSARIAMARALGVDTREASRYLNNRRNKPNGSRALALYAWLAKASCQMTWIPWETRDQV